MPKCIFCLNTDPTKFNTKEHILPESLGGGDWAILPEGLYCDSCQNKFGSTIEQQALADYPFISLRTFFSIPTKKRKAPWFNYWEGKIHSAGVPGKIIYEPIPTFKEAFQTGRKTLTIIPAMTKKPDMLLRTLIKIGLETIAADGGSDKIFNQRFDAARMYALTGKKTNPWFYIQKEDLLKLNQYIQGLDAEEVDFFIDIYDIAEGVEFLHLKVLYLEFIVPLIDNVILDKNLQLEEPEYKAIIV